MQKHSGPNTRPKPAREKVFRGVWWSILLLLLALAVWGGYSGCSKTAQSASPGPTAGSPAASADPNPWQPGEPTQEQPKLPTIKIWLGREEMVAEVAGTRDQQETGMMYRTNMAEGAGMLFPLFFTQRAAFWMKHCPLPLSAAYIDPGGVIQEIHDLQAHDTNSVIAASGNIRFVLETPQGWFQRHSIHEGMTVSTEHGPLMQTFFGKQKQ
jgi:uncharacterized membrane protein (UPF0127 family)